MDRFLLDGPLGVPVNYLLLTDQQKDQIALRKLLDLESEHCTLELSIRLATAAGIENDSVDAARQQVLILESQISILTSWIRPPVEDDDTDDDLAADAVTNGQRPVPAR